MKLADKAVAAVKNVWSEARGTPAIEEKQPKGPGDYERETLELVEALRDESYNYIAESGDGEKSIRDEWVDNANRFCGNFHSGVGDSAMVASSQSENFRLLNGRAINSGRVGIKRVYLMRTQNSVMANTAAATATPVYGRLSPVEFGAEDEWYLTPRGGRIVEGAIKASIDQRQAELEQLAAESESVAMQNPEDIEAATSAEQARHLLGTVGDDMAAEWGGITIDQYAGEDGPSQPVNEDQYGLLMEKAKNGMLPLREQDFIAMTDKFISQQAQIVCDVKTDQAGMPIYWLMYALYANIYGFACGEFEWHTTGRFRHGFTFDVSHPLNVFTDPCHFDMRFRGYHIEEKVWPLDKLLPMYPEHEEKLREAAREGKRNGEDGYDLGGTSENVDFQRKMVTVTTSWIRDQLVPLSPEDAVADGLVEELPVIAPTGEIDPDTGVEVEAEQYDEATGQPMKRYVLAETGEEVEPQEKIGHGTNWPDGPGLRQIVCIRSCQHILQDVRCPYPDIPRVWSMNVPRPDKSPFGQGEPVRLKHLDELINYTLSVLTNYIASLPFPTCLWPKSLMAKLQAAGVPLNLRPNMHIPIPDAQWSALMQAGGTDRLKFKAEPLPASYAEFFQMLLKEHDTMSNNVPVRQGREPYSGASGKTIQALQDGAESSLSIKSRLLEDSVVNFYRLLIHAITSWLPESEWAKILNRYRLPVIRRIIERVSMTQWDVTVKVSSGRGKDDDIDRQNAMAMFDKQLLSPEDALERMGDDDPQATAKKAKEHFMPGIPDAQAAMVQQAQQPQQVQQPPVQ